MDNKIAFLMAWFIQVLFRVYFKHIITHLESNWFDLWCNIFTAILYMAESLIWGTIKVRKSLSPFISYLIKNIWWDRELGAAGVNNGWVWSVFSWLLHCFTSIVHTLTFKGPCSKPVLKVLKCLESLSSSNDLSWVIATKESIWCLSHFSWSDTETNHGSIDDLIIFKRPQVMKLLFLHIFMWRKSKNTIRIMAQSLGFIEC